MTTRKAHKHVQEMIKKLHNPTDNDEKFLQNLKHALDKFTPDQCVAVLQLYSQDRDAVDALCQYARRYKARVPELEAADVKELQDFVQVQKVMTS